MDRKTNETGGVVRVRVPATSANLGPGFDSLGLALTMYNELELELYRQENFDIASFGEGAEMLPTDGTNMIWTTVRRLLSRIGLADEYRGMKLRMYSKIPVSRGLGSSATAIVGGLRAANEWLGRPLDKKGLLAIATELEGHPDNVAPAIYGGFSVSVTYEGKPESLAFLPEIPLKAVVAVPDFTLSTRLARSVLPDTVPRADGVFNVGRAALLAAAMARGKADYLKLALEDKLHQPYRKSLIPGFDEVTAAARKAGAMGCVLSGAGPTIIAFTLEKEAAVGDAMVESFRANGAEARAIVLSIDREGARVVSHRSAW